MVGQGVHASDGLVALSVGRWWCDKHYYVRRYCDIFSSGMSKRWSTRVYIDLFAGPGRALIEETRQEIDGSPLIALSQRSGFTSYFFADKDREYLAALGKRIERLSLPPSFEVRYYVDDCNAAAQKISGDLPPDNRWIGLAFLDPYSWDVALDSIAELAKGRRLDLMITFHTTNMRRCADNDPRALREFFGGPQWHEEYRARLLRPGARRGRVLLDLYEEALQRIGYPYVVDDVLIPGRSGRPLYHLIFASKHPLGEEFWRKISAKSPAGQGRLPLT